MASPLDNPDWQKQGSVYVRPYTPSVLQVATAEVDGALSGATGTIIADAAGKTVSLYGWMLGMRTQAVGQSRFGVQENNAARTLAGIVGHQLTAAGEDTANVALMFTIPIVCTKGNGLIWNNLGGVTIDLFAIVYYTQV